jgi:hypothetical protein
MEDKARVAFCVDIEQKVAGEGTNNNKILNQRLYKIREQRYNFLMKFKNFNQMCPRPSFVRQALLYILSSNETYG